MLRTGEKKPAVFETAKIAPLKTRVYGSKKGRQATPAGKHVVH